MSTDKAVAERAKRVSRLLPEQPWLSMLRSVRMFFRLFVDKFDERLKKADGLVTYEPPFTAGDIRRELLYLENVGSCESNGQRDWNLRQLFQESMQDIESSCIRVGIDPKPVLEYFGKTVAIHTYAARNASKETGVSRRYASEGNVIRLSAASNAR